MRAHILQHVPFEDVGSMAPWLAKAGAGVSYTRFFENHALPRIRDFDLIIIMGGPMSVNDESVLPWLTIEKEYIRDAVHAGVAVLGVCLGAQLIASALGARVYPNAHKEIGWFQVEAEPVKEGSLILPKTFRAFHWHGETFDLPAGALRLARSQACENQAFQVGRNVIGLQFHLEATPESVGALVDNCGNELVTGPFIQTESELRRADTASYVRINSIMNCVLRYVTKN
jgi:GMP synthase-like glutamine amidotransferase